MLHLETITHIRNRLSRAVLNELPAIVVNQAYTVYSKIYKGQISLGLPVSRQMLLSQEEIRSRAAGKLALTLYHLYWRITGRRIPRREIKRILLEELHGNRIRLTENVILLTNNELKYLTEERLDIPACHFSAIKDLARRRIILREAIHHHRHPVYFESDIDEREDNGRGDYEIVYYRDYTDEGKEIRFRRLVSVERVTSGDKRPSVVLVPGFANNSNCYNVTNRYSIAKDFADIGYWSYLFDPRGMGINEGKFDPYYTIDTLIDTDLPSVVRFIDKRSKAKPVTLIGHSMGGIVSENMVLNWGLRKKFHSLNHMDPEIRSQLNKILPAEIDTERYLKMVRGIITLGSPKFFQKRAHLAFPVGLWLNHLARILKLRQVPVQEVFWCLTQPPVLKEISRYFMNRNIGDLNFLINPENHIEDKNFVQKYLFRSMESVPLGMGFQLLKAIYNGEGFKRMDCTRLNYSDHIQYFPADIPLFHFWSTDDPIASPANIQFSQRYPHRYKRVYRIESAADLKTIEILPERSQLIDFVLVGVKHLDFLYGKTAKTIIFPLINRIMQKTWSQWSYGPDADDGVR